MMLPATALKQRKYRKSRTARGRESLLGRSGLVVVVVVVRTVGQY